MCMVHGLQVGHDSKVLAYFKSHISSYHGAGFILLSEKNSFFLKPVDLWEEFSFYGMGFDFSGSKYNIPR